VPAHIISRSLLDYEAVPLLSSMRSVTTARATARSCYCCELDSHADTCVAGPNTILIAEDGRVVNAFSYSRDKTSNVPIATVATLWEALNGEKLILIIHEYEAS
jgi:hypothetical protein